MVQKVEEEEEEEAEDQEVLSVFGLADGPDCIGAGARAKAEERGGALTSHTSTEEMPSMG